MVVLVGSGFIIITAIDSVVFKHKLAQIVREKRIKKIFNGSERRSRVRVRRRRGRVWRI
jgi:hypothetical protein